MEKTSAAQIEMVSLEDLVSADHVYRQYDRLLDIKRLTKPLLKLELPLGSVGYGIQTLFSCLLLQWIEDLSDRELEKYLQENTAGITDAKGKSTFFEYDPLGRLSVTRDLNRNVTKTFDYHYKRP